MLALLEAATGVGGLSRPRVWPTCCPPRLKLVWPGPVPKGLFSLSVNGLNANGAGPFWG